MKQPLALLLAALFSVPAIGQSIGDYRSAETGDWSSAATWQRFDGSNFVPAPAAPSLGDGVITIRAGHTVTRTTDLTIDQVVVVVGGALAIQNSTFSLLDGMGTDLQILGNCSLTNAALSGPGLAQVESGGVLSITNGGLSATSILSVLTGGTVNASGSITVSALGTINNAGIWNMQGGNLGQPSFSGGPCAFNNLPGGVVNLNDWVSTTNTWHQVTTNQGTFNKNNGEVPFGFSNDFSGKSFTNAAGGVVNATSGTVLFNCPTTNAGSLTGSGGYKHDSASSGGAFTNQIGGTITAPFEQASAQMTVNGTLTLATFTLSGGVVSGTEAITIPNGGQFTWTGGRLDGTTVLNILQGGTATSNSSTTLDALGTINNAGIWNLVGGNVGQSSFVGGPCAFNNLPSGVVNLNGWGSNTNSWHQVTNNQGSFNKNNGSITFTFSNDFSGKAFNNLSGGTLNATAGNVVFATTVNNSGSMVAGSGARFIHNTSAGGSPFTNLTGGAISGEFEQAGGTMNITGTLTMSALIFTGGGIEGPEAISISNGGTFTWTNGTLGASGIIELQSGSTATYNTTGNNASSIGTINNAGTWNMEGGVMGQVTSVTGPKAFNNLPGGVVNLIGWSDNSTTWRQVTNNQGTINKNNGSNQFTFSNAQGPNSFTNLPGGTVNLGIGNMALSVPLPVQSGTFNLSSGTTLFINNDLNYAGPGIVNNGTIAGDDLRFQGTTAQTLEGTGSIAFLAIDNAAGVDLGGDQTVTNTLTLTNGQLRLGDHDLLVQSTLAAAVSGGSSTSWVRTNGTGTLRRLATNGPSYRFPVGTASYAPLLLILMNAPQETFSVRVQEGVSTEYDTPGTASGQNITSDVVGLTWVLQEQTPGGHTVNMAVDWNASDELSLFNRNACRVSYYDGTNWVPGTTAAATGTGPFTRSFIGLTNFRELCVSDTDADLNGISTALPEEAEGAMRVYPVPAGEVLFIDFPAGSSMHELLLFDAGGRAVIQATANSNERLSIPVEHLNPGMYMLVLRDAQGEWHRHRISIVR
jgi:hypothetical protein